MKTLNLLLSTMCTLTVFLQLGQKKEQTIFWTNTGVHNKSVLINLWSSFRSALKQMEMLSFFQLSEEPQGGWGRTRIQTQRFSCLSICLPVHSSDIHGVCFLGVLAVCDTVVFDLDNWIFQVGISKVCHKTQDLPVVSQRVPESRVQETLLIESFSGLSNMLLGDGHMATDLKYVYVYATAHHDSFQQALKRKRCGGRKFCLSP